MYVKDPETAERPEPVKDARPARVTVGIPAYNNERTIAKTLDSVLGQSFHDIRVIVSEDGGSQDRTAEICRRYEASDPRVRFIKQESNLYYLNFRFVLEQATTPYFVWIAGDDLWRPTFLEKCLGVLEKREDAVCCVPRCQFMADGDPLFLARGTGSLDEDWATNVATYLQAPKDNTRMYGVFRTGALKAAFPSTIMHAYDWALSAATLKYGKHIEIPEILMVRDKTRLESYIHSVKKDERRTLLRPFPVLRMSAHLVLKRKIPLTRDVLSSLLKINYKKHKEYMRMAKPRVYNSVGWLYGRRI